MTKKIRKNGNGHLTEVEFVKMIHKGTLDSYMRKFRLVDEKCPPYILISSDQTCTYCESCHRHCASEVKEYKNYYKIGKKKFLKEELDELD